MNKYFIFLYASVVFFVVGCTTDIDLKNIDTKMDVAMNLAVPLGDMTFYVNDFLRDGRSPYVAPDEDGLYHFRETFSTSHDFFDTVNVSSFVIQTQLMSHSFKESVSFNDTSFQIDFTLNSTDEKVTFDIPQHDSLRIDSIILHNFEVCLDQFSYTDILYESSTDTISRFDFTRIELLPNEFINFDLNSEEFEVEIDRDDKDISWCKKPITLKTCTLKLGDANQRNDIKFSYKFYLKNDSKSIAISKDESKFHSAVNCNFKKSTYDAIWGYFKPAYNKSVYRDSFKIEGDLIKITDLEKVNISLLDPSIRCFVSHSIAGQPLNIIINNISTVDSSGKTISSASWKNGVPHYETLYPSIPLNSDLNTSTTCVLDFNKENGAIDKLLSFNTDNKPDSMQYSISFCLADPNEQYRITKNTKVNAQFTFDIPFTYKDSVDFLYNSLSRNSSINTISVDSIIKNNDNIDTISQSRVQLFITLQNSMPFDVEGIFEFIDSTQQDSVVTMQIIQDSTLNHFICKAPVLKEMKGFKVPEKPTQSTIVLDVTNSAFHELAHVTGFRVILHAKNYEQDANYKIDTSSKFMIQLGLATNLEAIFNFNEKESTTSASGAPASTSKKNNNQ